MVKETAVSQAKNIRLSQLAGKIFQGLYPSRKNGKITLSKNVPAINIKKYIGLSVDFQSYSWLHKLPIIN